MDFADCNMGITGQAVADKILNFLQKFNLDPRLLRGQGYDGAGNMAGKTSHHYRTVPTSTVCALYFLPAEHNCGQVS